MTLRKNVLWAMGALMLAGSFTMPVVAAEEIASGHYVLDGNGNPISDGFDNCVGDASLAEGTARKCGAAAPAVPTAEPRKEAPTSGA